MFTMCICVTIKLWCWQWAFMCSHEPSTSSSYHPCWTDEPLVLLPVKQMGFLDRLRCSKSSWFRESPSWVHPTAKRRRHSLERVWATELAVGQDKSNLFLQREWLATSCDSCVFLSYWDVDYILHYIYRVLSSERWWCFMKRQIDE